MVVHPPTILSLASGYGGLEIGVELLLPGARAVCYVEREGYAAANLVARFQDETLAAAPIWDDVATFDGEPWRDKVDWIVGGYPCQPFSVAGRRQGENDPRHLWPSFARIVREVEPDFCFFENVSNHLGLGFDQVGEDLQGLGYKVAATLVTAQEVGAPQRRERLFVLARRLADTQSNERRSQQQTKGARLGGTGSPGIREELGDPDHFDGGKAIVRKTERGGHDQPSIPFPPGRNEWEAWERLLDKRPDLAPAIESEVRKPPDGHPYWADELRLAGNGVVPLQAAYALATLLLDLGVEICPYPRGIFSAELSRN